MEQPSKKIHQRTWETYNHCHRGNKRDKLYLLASLSGNYERQHVVFHWVFHHRHGLHIKNNSILKVMMIIILITRDSVLTMLQWQKTLKSFFFPACVRFPLDFQCIFIVVLIIIIIIIIIIIFFFGLSAYEDSLNSALVNMLIINFPRRWFEQIKNHKKRVL